MILAGIFGPTLAVFAVTHIHIRLILNRITIEGQSTPKGECFHVFERNGHPAKRTSAMRRYMILGLKGNWQQAMGEDGKVCSHQVLAVRGTDAYKGARQLKDYCQQEEVRLLQWEKLMSPNRSRR